MKRDTKSCLIEAHLLPSVEYFCVLHQYDKVILEKHENYTKQSYRNRCYILTSQGPARLTIPVENSNQKTPISLLKIDYSTRWENNFVRTLESAYAKAPFFEHYGDELNRIILSRQPYLYDLNVRLLSMCLQWLGWDLPIEESTLFEKSPPDGIKDLRNHISAKKGYETRDFLAPLPYHQIFGNNFASNLSLVDLVFCTGPEATAVIRGSQKKI